MGNRNGNGKNKGLLAKIESGASMSNVEFKRALLREGLSVETGNKGRLFIRTSKGYLTDSHGNRAYLSNTSKGEPTREVYNAVKKYLNGYQP